MWVEIVLSRNECYDHHHLHRCHHRHGWHGDAMDATANADATAAADATVASAAANVVVSHCEKINQDKDMFDG